MSLSKDIEAFNSVAEKYTNACPKCGIVLRPNAKFCTVCGASVGSMKKANDEQGKLTSRIVVKKSSGSVTAEIKQEALNKTLSDNRQPEGVAEIELLNKPVFAEGLPAWDMLPPQVMVRRKKK